MSYKVVDLFAGIGGFHAALSAFGFDVIYASEWDEDAARTYFTNWGIQPKEDINQLANSERMDIPPHDILVGGFPCQPFSKSGKQKGESESRGTLFWNIEQIISKRHPKIVLLENVRNLAGPKHIDTFNKIIGILKREGYVVASDPLIISPHKVHPRFGGSPQIRERLFIAATLSEEPRVPNITSDVSQLDMSHLYAGWEPSSWDLAKFLDLENSQPTAKENFAPRRLALLWNKLIKFLTGQKLELEKSRFNSRLATLSELRLTDEEVRWIDTWDEFVQILKTQKIRIPGFPLWSQYWGPSATERVKPSDPDWKKDFIKKNVGFYEENQKLLETWLSNSGVRNFPPSRQKLEWQAQDETSLWNCIMHLRPSGIRAKKPTYVPTLVAINQTTVYGPGRLVSMLQWFITCSKR